MGQPKPRKSVRTKLWVGGTLVAAFVLTLVVGNFIIPKDKAVDLPMLGHDFTAFYTAGHFAHTGHFEKLYDVQAVKDFEQETGRRAGLKLGDSYGPFWNPPFYAWVFAPLSTLAYGKALLVWTLINLACGAAAVVLLVRMLAPAGSTLAEAGIDWKSWVLIPLLLLVSMPFIQCISHGQNTLTSLLLLSAAVTFWRARKGILAGMIAGLLFYKPQLGAVVALVLVLTLGWRALVGVGITGLVLLAITMATMPGVLATYLHQLPINVRFMQIEHPYVWERHATIKAFWRMLLQGRGAGEPMLLVTVLTAVLCAAVAVPLIAVVVGYVRLRMRGVSAERAPLDPVIAATIAAMPLLMPFYFDYDLMLLAVPAVLLAGDKLNRLRQIQSHLIPCDSALDILQCAYPADRWLVRIWMGMFLWMGINPGMTTLTRVNLTVPMLCMVAGLLSRRALRLQARIGMGAAVDGTVPQRLAA